MTIRTTESHGAPEGRPIDQTTAPDDRSPKRIRIDPHNKKQQLCPQQRYVKPPKHPGMATFDPGLRKLPLQRPRQQQQRLPLHLRSDYTSMTEEGADTSDASSEDDREGVSSLLIDITSKLSVESSLPESKTGRQPPMSELALALSEPGLQMRHRTVSQQGDVGYEQFDSMTTIPQRSTFSATSQFEHMEQSYLLAKFIYVDLLSITDHSDLPLASVTAKMTEHLDTAAWRNLHGLRKALLMTSHDFFAITQDASVSESLKLLGKQWMISAEDCKREAKDFKSIVRQASSSHQNRMYDFICKARIFVISHSKTAALAEQLSGVTADKAGVTEGGAGAAEWHMITKNMHRLTHTLLSDGAIDKTILDYSARYAPEAGSEWEEFMKAPSHTFDEELRQWYVRRYLQSSVPSVWEVERQYRTADMPLKDCVIWSLCGWLCYGPKLARTFHEFCKVFKFLAWFGATF